MHELDVFWRGFIASLLAGLGTAVGAAWVLLFRRPSARARDALLSAAAGVMLAATFFSLLQPGITYADHMSISSSAKKGPTAGG